MPQDSDTESEPESSQFQWDAAYLESSIHGADSNSTVDGRANEGTAKNAKAAIEALRRMDIRDIRQVGISMSKGTSRMTQSQMVEPRTSQGNIVGIEHYHRLFERSICRAAGRRSSV